MKLSITFKKKVEGFTIIESLAALVVLSLGIVLLFNAFSYVHLNNFNSRTNTIYSSLDSVFYSINSVSDLNALENVEHISISTNKYSLSDELVELTVTIDYTKPEIRLSKLIKK